MFGCCCIGEERIIVGQGEAFFGQRDALNTGLISIARAGSTNGNHWASPPIVAPADDDEFFYVMGGNAEDLNGSYYINCDSTTRYFSHVVTVTLERVDGGTYVLDDNCAFKKEVVKREVVYTVNVDPFTSGAITCVESDTNNEYIHRWTRNETTGEMDLESIGVDRVDLWPTPEAGWSGYSSANATRTTYGHTGSGTSWEGWIKYDVELLDCDGDPHTVEIEKRVKIDLSGEWTKDDAIDEADRLADIPASLTRKRYWCDTIDTGDWSRASADREESIIERAVRTRSMTTEEALAADHYFRVRQMNGPDGAVRDYHFDLDPIAFIPETPPTHDAVISDVFFTADLLQYLMIRRRHAHVFTGADPSIKYCLLHIEYEAPGGCNVDVRADGETVQKDQYGPGQSIILRPATSLIYDPGVLRVAVSTRTGLEPFRGYTNCDAL